jgi:hypothetical protein
MIGFLILSIQIFYHTLGGTAGTDWLLGKIDFFLSALVILGLSCRSVIFLMGKRILFICIVFSWKSNTTPRLCIVCLPIMRSYIGA